MEKPKIDKFSECRRLNFDDEGSNTNKAKSLKKAATEQTSASSDSSTGAIPKKIKSYKSIKPSNSFKHSDNGWYSFFSHFNSLSHSNFHRRNAIEFSSNEELAVGQISSSIKCEKFTGSF